MVNILVDFVSLLCMVAWFLFLAAIAVFACIVVNEMRKMLVQAVRSLWRMGGHGRNAFAGGARSR